MTRRRRRLLQPHYYRSYKYGVFVALLGLLGRLSVVGRVGRHVELFLDAWDGRGPLGLRPDVASFILKTSRSRRLWDIGDIGEGQQGVDGDVRRDQWIWDTLKDLLVADIFVKIIRLRRYSVVVIFFCLFVSSSRGVAKRKNGVDVDLI